MAVSCQSWADTGHTHSFYFYDLGLKYCASGTKGPRLWTQHCQDCFGPLVCVWILSVKLCVGMPHRAHLHTTSSRSPWTHGRLKLKIHVCVIVALCAPSSSPAGFYYTHPSPFFLFFPLSFQFPIETVREVWPYFSSSAQKSSAPCLLLVSA